MCNGWSNRETWLVNLWFGDSFAAMQDDGETITAEYIRETVEQYIEEKIGSDWSNFIIDMMCLGVIDYEELASHYAPEEEEEEEEETETA